MIEHENKLSGKSVLRCEAENSDAITKVAIVEGNSAMLQYLSELISSTADYACACACTSAAEAMIQVPETRPHVVLMDIRLPDESGIACAAYLREKIPSIQIIVLTVFFDIRKIFEVLEAGACGYLLKRSSSREILDAIAEVRAGGAPMTSLIARMLVRSFSRDATLSLRTDSLSPCAAGILALAAKGHSNEEISEILNISVGAVGIYIGHIYQCLHARCQTAAATKYFRPHPPGANKSALPPPRN